MTNVDFVKKKIDTRIIKAINSQTGEIYIVGLIREELYNPNYAIKIYGNANDGSDDCIISKEDFNNNFLIMAIESF